MSDLQTMAKLDELTGDYVLDSGRTQIGFAARAMVTRVRGQFGEFEGSANLDGDDPSKSSVRLTIQAASVQTRNRRRDDHLRRHFLDAGRHPAITFISTGVEQAGQASFTVAGDLTIRGVTRPVTLDLQLAGAASDPRGSFRVRFESQVTIDRTDWGVRWGPAESGGILVSQQVTLELDVAAVRSA
jgi:polyisoprenoid-binding protein YceI